MPIDESSVINLLIFLRSKYPKVYDSIQSLMKEIPHYVNKNTLLDDLHYCWKKGYINYSLNKDPTGVVDLNNIKIKLKGVSYLKDFKNSIKKS